MDVGLGVTEKDIIETEKRNHGFGVAMFEEILRHIVRISIL